MWLVVLGLVFDLVVDLWYLNKGCLGDIFEVFFSVFEMEVEDLVVVDERRYNIEYILKFILVCDLIE